MLEGLREACGALGLPLADPRERMRAAEDAGRATYFVRDGHWTAEGHALAAQVIAEALQNDGLACAR